MSPAAEALGHAESEAGTGHGVVLDQVLATGELFRRFERAAWRVDLDEDERRRRTDELVERQWLQVAEQNEWICEVAAEHPAVSAVLAADPTVDTGLMTAELSDKIRRPGVRAIKIHPALSFVMPDHPAPSAVCGFAEEAGLPVISHGGSSAGTFYESEVEYCAPGNFAPVLDQFPRLRLVLAHLGQPPMRTCLPWAPTIRTSGPISRSSSVAVSFPATVSSKPCEHSASSGCCLAATSLLRSRRQPRLPGRYRVPCCRDRDGRCR